MEPGGLRKFCDELAAFMQPRLGTDSQRRFGRRKYTRAECLQVWEEMPRSVRSRLEEADEALSLSLDESQWERDERCRREAEQRRALEKQIVEGNEPHLTKLAIDACTADLQEMLKSLCLSNDENVSRWWCPDVLAEVLAFVDARAETIKQRLASTAVAEQMFDALDYAASERVMIRIEGESRFGKTESLETYAAMWPGRLRVVRTPSFNSERDIIKAVAEAYGIHQTYGARSESYKDKVDFVLRFSGLMMAFDEGAFLIPSSFTANTPPARLNWVRCAIVDRRIPCVIVVTPQSYNGAVNRFVKKTQYSIEQFLGREALRITLPNELSHHDLMAVARVHFPEADDDLLELIVCKAMQSESYLKAVEDIARRARYHAKKRNAQKLNLADVDTAIAEVMPQPAVAAQPAPQAPKTARPVQKRRSAAATLLQAPFRNAAHEDFPARQTTPLDTLPEGESAAVAG